MYYNRERESYSNVNVKKQELTDVRKRMGTCFVEIFSLLIDFWFRFSFLYKMDGFTLRKIFSKMKEARTKVNLQRKFQWFCELSNHSTMVRETIYPTLWFVHALSRPKEGEKTNET